MGGCNGRSHSQSGELFFGTARHSGAADDACFANAADATAGRENRDQARRDMSRAPRKRLEEWPCDRDSQPPAPGIPQSACVRFVTSCRTTSDGPGAARRSAMRWRHNADSMEPSDGMDKGERAAPRHDSSSQSGRCGRSRLSIVRCVQSNCRRLLRSSCP